MFSFLTPLFGVTFGVLVLGERLDAAFGVGAALVLAGITLVSAPGSRRRVACGSACGSSQAPGGSAPKGPFDAVAGP